jgi:hypothetical protein
VETFTRRSLTVLRDDLSLQLDVDIHQVMFDWIPGVYVENEVSKESYELTPDGVTLSWCEIDYVLAWRARECWPQVCASPTSRVRFPYDIAEDLYTKGSPEALRPVVEGSRPGGSRTRTEGRPALGARPALWARRALAGPGMLGEPVAGLGSDSRNHAASRPRRRD